MPVETLHPAEVQMGHMMYGEIFYMHDLESAWTHTGYMITCPHATLMMMMMMIMMLMMMMLMMMMMMMNALNMLPTGKDKLEALEVFDALFHNCMKMTDSRHISGQNASFIVRQDDQSRDWHKDFVNFETLQGLDSEFWLPTKCLWMSSEGLVPVDQFLSIYESMEGASRITSALPDAMNESMDTMPFQPVLKVMRQNNVYKAVT